MTTATTHAVEIIQNMGRLAEYEPAARRRIVEVIGALTKSGRDIVPVEVPLTRMLAVLLALPLSVVDVQEEVRVHTLALVTQIMQFNFSAIPEEERTHLLSAVIACCDAHSDVDVLSACLGLFDVVVRYGFVNALLHQQFVCALCRLVNLQALSNSSWGVMRNLLLGTAGHRTVTLLCDLLSTPQRAASASLLRGAVFFVSMASWGAQRVPSIHSSPSVVLPALARAVSSLDSSETGSAVSYEIALSVSRLVKKYGHELHAEWDTLLLTLSRFLPFLQRGRINQSRFVTVISDCLVALEKLLRKGHFSGDRRRLLGVFELYVFILPETTVLRLLEQAIRSSHPANADWQTSLHRLMLVHYRNQPRVQVRVRALVAVRDLFRTHWSVTQPHLLDTVLPFIEKPPQQQLPVGVRSSTRSTATTITTATTTTSSSGMPAAPHVQVRGVRSRHHHLLHNAAAQSSSGSETSGSESSPSSAYSSPSSSSVSELAGDGGGGGGGVGEGGPPSDLKRWALARVRLLSLFARRAANDTHFRRVLSLLERECNVTGAHAVSEVAARKISKLFEHKLFSNKSTHAVHSFETLLRVCMLGTSPARRQSWMCLSRLGASERWYVSYEGRRSACLRWSRRTPQHPGASDGVRTAHAHARPQQLTASSPPRATLSPSGTRARRSHTVAGSPGRSEPISFSVSLSNGDALDLSVRSSHSSPTLSSGEASFREESHATPTPPTLASSLNFDAVLESILSGLREETDLQVSERLARRVGCVCRVCVCVCACVVKCSPVVCVGNLLCECV
jgi:Domain of unknown function (DUF3384)